MKTRPIPKNATLTYTVQELIRSWRSRWTHVLRQYVNDELNYEVYLDGQSALDLEVSVTEQRGFKRIEMKENK